MHPVKQEKRAESKREAMGERSQAPVFQDGSVAHEPQPLAPGLETGKDLLRLDRDPDKGPPQRSP